MSPTGLPMRGAGAKSVPLLEASPPLRACLLSGGVSRRMGRDKALLLHPEGGTWLERTLRLLLTLDIPVTLFSRHDQHLQLVRALPAAREAGDDGRPAPRISPLAEPAPWEGPLLALLRLMQRYPDQRLLLCPVDMPWLNRQALHTLLQAAAGEPERIHLAHDGEHCQPVLGVYPSAAPLRTALAAAVQRGERRLQGWLASQAPREVRLERQALRNVNRPGELTPGTEHHASPQTEGAPPPRHLP